MKYTVTRDIFVPCTSKALQYKRFKKGQIIETDVLYGKEVMPGTLTKIYYYLKTGSLVRGTKMKKRKDSPRVTPERRRSRRPRNEK